MSKAPGVRVLPFALGAVCLAFGCEARVAPAATATVTTTTTVTNVDSSGVAQVIGPSWTLEVGADVRYESVVESGPGGALTSSTLNGAPFEVRDGRLFLDQVDFGPVPQGAKLRVSSDGVFVDGERRGATPELADAGGE